MSDIVISTRPTTAQAEAIYEVLVSVCGASNKDSDRWQFTSYVSARGAAFNDDLWREYRFIGRLGFGGKFNIKNGGSVWVSCYPEDETPERLSMIEEANSLIAKILNGEK